jgi:hypothetical protein
LKHSAAPVKLFHCKGKDYYVLCILGMPLIPSKP